MIPIELTIQGLYSYQERQTIDFTRLTAANLFGIFEYGRKRQVHHTGSDYLRGLREN